MAIVSAAIAAVAAAITATSVATVAAAVVTVSTVIGVAGLAVSAVGMITGNQDLLKVGEIMGFVGLAGGIAGGIAGAASVGPKAFASQLAQTYDDAWNQGIGKLFTPSATNITGGQAGTSPFAASTAKADLSLPPLKTGVSPQPSKSLLGSAYSTSPNAPAATPVSTGVTAQSPSVSPASVPSHMGVAPPAPPQAPVGPAAPSAPSIMDSASVASVRNAPVGSGMQGVFQTPGVQAPLGSQSSFASTLANITGPAKTQSLTDWFTSLHPSMQASLAMVGGQGLAGAMGGYFEGRSMEEKLELERLINDQNEAQRQLYNRNMATSPLIQFAPQGGLLNAAGGRA